MLVGWSIREIKQSRMAVKRVIETGRVGELQIAVM